MVLSALMLLAQWLGDVDGCKTDAGEDAEVFVKDAWSVPVAIRWDTQARLLALLRSACFEIHQAADQGLIRWICWTSKQNWALPTLAPLVLRSVVFEDPDRDFAMPMYALSLEKLDPSLHLPARAYANRYGRSRDSYSLMVFTSWF